MKKVLTVILIILGGIIGSALGDMCVSIKGLQWLALGGTIGIKEPVVLSLSFVELTLGFWCKMNIAGVIGLLFMAFISKKVLSWVKI